MLPPTFNQKNLSEKQLIAAPENERAKLSGITFTVNVNGC
jgi:hypothetical protein